ncbi:sigma-54-dependent Fis family transcriptional regulator [Candidatus Poribacteria bacterium]|nr:sigma-54-dependent Fis family transcriptional regulator [Candidatus Poribacteria bacterium]MBT5535348.1 sigma-54-dependent Fis family transcriptional regulator [Candidatus Poribacteria bacterium]MBT5714302.1 sigma-54-dependent Fis family transcriptional regulator [Candidatus Poribacteria bacterium]MBT7097487.1 sigma-54-dependent Fis family transcriptional regulator [Candidatus Poribacteria bacterium]MBT7809159.1 sigma-54-dependent Fis family transcriptional regulator [Candidatus Poribacteria
MRILVIDDDDAQRRMLRGFLRKLDHEVLDAGTGEEGVAIAESEGELDLVISDIRMPGIDGLEVLRRLRAMFPELAVLLATAFATYAQAVEAAKAGAWDYLAKPLDLDDLRVKIWKIEGELGRDTEAAPDATDADGFIAESPAMRDVLALLERAAPTDATILLLGESGVGKNVLAERIHQRSKRAAATFGVVSCAALPETLIESELFGHEKGAYTGADRARDGRFEAADGGTLFLDEIGEVPLGTQVKLLRVLQERVVERIGASGKPISVDVRIIAATNSDLEAAVDAGTFRQDLFYRLNVVTVEVPPLRDRRADIPALIDAFLRSHTPEGQATPVLDEEAERALLAHDYPGNVRELQNAIERAAILAQAGRITTMDLPPTLTRGAPAPAAHADTLPAAVEDLERQYIAEALHETDGVQTRAAERLGITERNLRYKLRKYGLTSARESTG